MTDQQRYVVVESNDPLLADGIYFMVVAGIITLLVSTCIGLHLIKHLYKQYISKTLTKHQIIQGDVCILFAVQIIATFARAISDLFMRTDYIIPSYNINLCGIGWFIYAYSPYVAKTFLFLLILYRTRLVFKHTQYELDKCVFLTCFVGVCLEIAIVGIMYIGLVATHNKPWKLRKLLHIPKGNDDYVSYCQLNESYILFINLVTVFALVMDLFWSSCAAYILITRLRKMRDDLTAMHKKEMSKIQLTLQTVNSDTEHTVSGIEHTVSGIEHTISDLGSTESSGGFRNNSTPKKKRVKDVQGVAKLEHIMYKQTMLTMFALISSILWALIVFPANHLLHGFAIDLATNLICSWLLFKFSKDVWLKIFHYCCYACRYKARVYD